MPKTHISNPFGGGVAEKTLCGIAVKGMPCAEFVKRYVAGDIPDDACARCVDSAQTQWASLLQLEAKRILNNAIQHIDGGNVKMGAARVQVEGWLHAWADAAEKSDTQAGKRNYAAAQAMLWILDAGGMSTE